MTSEDINYIPLPSKTKPKIEASWLEKLQEDFDAEYMQSLRQFLKEEIVRGKSIFPEPTKIFEAYNQTPFHKVKVIILGQDPYHGFGQAHGLSFSVNKGVPMPPSLRNIFKELVDDLGVESPKSGDLTPWARQGVLLLNCVLTVEASLPASHANRGWEVFTDKTIRVLSEDKNPKVFLLWGAYAQKKAILIDSTIHCLIESPHPSPFSAHRGFLGSRPFSRANIFLESRGRSPVDWSLQNHLL